MNTPPNKRIENWEERFFGEFDALVPMESVKQKIITFIKQVEQDALRRGMEQVVKEIEQMGWENYQKARLQGLQWSNNNS